MSPPVSSAALLRRACRRLCTHAAARTSCGSGRHAISDTVAGIAGSLAVTGVSNLDITTSAVPGWLRPVVDWNPMSALLLGTSWLSVRHLRAAD